MPNLCGVNQKQLSDALLEIKRRFKKINKFIFWHFVFFFLQHSAKYESEGGTAAANYERSRTQIQSKFLLKRKFKKKFFLGAFPAPTKSKHGPGRVGEGGGGR